MNIDLYLARMLCPASLSDFVTLYVSICTGAGPTPVDIVDYLKKKTTE